MQALIVEPGRANSARIHEVPDPRPAADELLVEGVALGLCGTDREILSGRYGWAPPSRPHLVIGHESLGRVRQAPDRAAFTVDDLVVGVVRRPDPVPCGACERGQFDMCRNGRYTERGIKELDGYGSQFWTLETDYAVKVDDRIGEVGNLIEPASVVVKAWEQVDRVGARAWFEPKRALITGAGTIGLLAALMAVKRGLDVHVLDVVPNGPKPRAVKALGAEYHCTGVREVTSRTKPDVVIEATGASSLIFDVLAGTAAYGIVCLTGVSPAGRPISVDAGATDRQLVLENDVVIGSVNANLEHYRAAAATLAAADPDWLAGLITRRVPLRRFAEALDPRPDDIKVVLTLP